MPVKVTGTKIFVPVITNFVSVKANIHVALVLLAFAASSLTESSPLNAVSVSVELSVRELYTKC